MADQLLIVQPRIEDNTVNTYPLAGGTITFFRSGTTDLVDVFSDVGLATPRANPMSADAAGRFENVFFSGGFDVKAVIRNASGTQIDVLDPCFRQGANVTFDTIAEMIAGGGFFVGSQITVATGWNGQPEEFKIVAAATYTANAATVINLVGITGQAVSLRREFRTYAELAADTRPAAFFVTDAAVSAEATRFSVLGLAEYNMALSGTAIVSVANPTGYHKITAGGVKLYSLQPTNVKALGAVGDGVTDDGAIFALAGLIADSMRLSSIRIPAGQNNYLLSSVMVVREPGVEISGDHGPGYQRGTGKNGVVLISAAITHGFDFGASRPGGVGENPADHWSVSRVGVKQASGVTAVTKDGWRFTAINNGPDRGAVFDKVSATGMNAAIRVMDTGESTQLASLVVRDSVLSNNNYAVLAEGSTLGVMVEGCQMEQNLICAISGTMTGPITIKDNMLEGQPTVFNVTSSSFGNRPKITFTGNYCEAITGAYIGKMKCTADGSFEASGNYFLSDLSDDHYLITGSGSWTINVNESAGSIYRGITLDNFLANINPNSYWLHKGAFYVRGITSGFLTGALHTSRYQGLTGESGGTYVDAVISPSYYPTVNSPFGKVLALNGPAFQDIALSVTAGDLFALDMLAYSAGGGTEIQVWNASTTQLIASGPVPSAAGWSLVTVVGKAAFTTASLRVRVLGVGTNDWRLAGMSGRNYGNHVGDGSDVKKIYPKLPPFNNSGAIIGSSAYNPPSIAAGASTTTVVAVFGANLGGIVDASFSLNPAGVRVTGWVDADDSVTFKFLNETAGTVDLAAGSIHYRVYNPPV